MQNTTCYYADPTVAISTDPIVAISTGPTQWRSQGGATGANAPDLVDSAPAPGS